MTRSEKKAAFWSRVEESIEGYAGRINLLLEELTDEQLDRVLEIVHYDEEVVDPRDLERWRQMGSPILGPE